MSDANPRAETTPTDRAEVALLGALLFAPPLIPLADRLRPDDFSTPPRRAIAAVLEETRRAWETGNAPKLPDLIYWEQRLLERRAPVPEGVKHWFTVLSRFIDFADRDGAIDEEVVPLLVGQVLGASIARRALARRQG